MNKTSYSYQFSVYIKHLKCIKNLEELHKSKRQNQREQISDN